MMNTLRTLVALVGQGLLLLALGGPLSPAVAQGTPPATEQRPVTETLHGQTFTDPFRWLEGDLSDSDPNDMGARTPEVDAWTDAQNAYTREFLDALPGREALSARLRELMDIPTVGSPRLQGSRYFYSRRDKGMNQSIHCVRELNRDGTLGEQRVLLDPNVIDPTGLTTISWTVPSPDGELMAFGLYRSGDENSTLYLMDVASGEWLADEIPGKVNGVEWLADGRRFWYQRLGDIDDPYSGEALLHEVGRHHRQDRRLFTQREPEWFYGALGYSKERLKELRTTWGPGLSASRDGRWALISYATGTDSADLWTIDLAEWTRTGKAGRPAASIGQKGRSGSTRFLGDTLFLETQIGAPNGRIVAIDLHQPGMNLWRDIVPERKDAVIDGVAFSRSYIAVTYLVKAQSEVLLYAYDGSGGWKLPLPGIGTAGLSADEETNEAFLGFSSYNMPRTVYRMDLDEVVGRLGRQDPRPATFDAWNFAIWDRPAVPVDPSLVEVKQVTYTSKDGTPVTMFVVHKKGLKLDGTNPTLLYGYGGFNISQTPGFSATMFPWYEAGGVYAVANLRGGGEYGAEWHRAGMLESKQNVFDDFIAAGEWLVANKYTSPAKLACAGGSNGGLLTGAMITQRPDLFRAVICSVPLLDMLRYQSFLMARYWVPEYGDPADPEQFGFIREYSPYHNITPGTEYPSVLLLAGENDTRVHPMHARKMAAALQDATTADPTDKPIFLWVDRDSGHGGGKPLDLRVRDIVDQRLFLMSQLGMLPSSN